MTPDEIMQELRRLAPSVAFTVTGSVDHDFRWDGDGPDPMDEGYDPYNVEVRARAIIGGVEVEEAAYMGGHYKQPDEPFSDLGGYLPQMLEEAARDLREILLGSVAPTAVINELAAACAFIREEMRRRYEEQRREIEAA